MTFYIIVTDNRIHFRAMLDEGDTIGDFQHEIKKGETFAGHDFDYFVKHGNGEIELEVK